MSAERTPRADHSLLSAPIAGLTYLALRWPKSILVGSLLLAVAAVVLAMNSLGFHTSRLDLISPDSDYNKLWLEYIDEFGDQDDAVVVFEAEDVAQLTSAIDALGEKLESEPDRFAGVLHRVELSAIRAKGLHYLSLEELAQLDRSLMVIEPVLQGEWAQVRLDTQLRTAAQFAHSAQQAPHLNSGERSAVVEVAAAHLQRLAASLVAALRDVPDYRSPWPLEQQSLSKAHFDHPEHLLTEDGRFGFILLHLAQDESGLAPRSAAIDRLRELIHEVGQDHAGVTIGLTGLPVLEDDEMRISRRDMTLASTLSFIGVVVLFMAGLGGLRYPALAVAVLAIAFCWTFGWMTLAVGHLNILTVSFGSILIGMGIDFAIHYVLRYLELRKDTDSRNALITTGRSIGPGVVTGAVTTAAGFLAAHFTPFTGLAELGIIAGGGIVLCLMAVLLLLPPMILLSDASRPRTVLSEIHVDRWFALPQQFPRTAIWVSLGVTAIAAYAALHVRYDHNLLNLQARGLESVELEEKLLTETDHSVWFALSLADSPEELLAKKEQFSRLTTVERVEEIVSILPTDVDAKRPAILRLHGRLQNLPEEPPLIPTASREELLQAIAAAHASLKLLAEHDEAAQLAQSQFAAAYARLQQLGARDTYVRIAEFQQRSAKELLAQLVALRSVATPEPPQLGDLPNSLVARFVGKHERHLLKIYGRGELWDDTALGQFVADVKSVDPNTTGQPLQTFYASRQMKESYLQAAFYALVAVIVLLICDFRSITASLLVLMPLGLGMLQMLGLMAWLDIPLNPANMIVLPLILGIGMDYGVHVVHDYRHTAGRYRLRKSIAVAILLAALTTMLGFGSLMIANHRGLESLGRVLTIGVSCCLLNSLVILPAALAWLSQRHVPESDPSAVATQAAAHVVATPAHDDSRTPRRRAA
jgi:hopanoid biosynthesis associated RND transporter like protein HpnN